MTKKLKLPRGLGWIKADFTQASSPIIWIDDRGYDNPTVFQVADARHSTGEAKRMVAQWLASQRG